MTSLPDKVKKYYIKPYDELYTYIDSKLRKTTIPVPPRLRRDKTAQLKNILLGKLAIAYNIVDKELEKIINIVEEIEKSNPFYVEIYRMITGTEPGITAKKLRIARRNLRRIYYEYRVNIKNSYSGKEASGHFKAGLGRILSFYRRNDQLIQAIKKVVVEIAKLPDISGDLMVIIAGMPQVGKSTIIRSLTNAEPEIGNYPFTTKNIIVGHITVKHLGKITLIDTPGLLDRPQSMRNEIENKAILAIKHLADKAVYVFDPSPQSYYTLNEQLRVYREVEELVGSENILPVINKIDITPKQLLEKTHQSITRETGKKPLLISALRGEGLEELKNILIRFFMEKTQFPQQRLNPENPPRLQRDNQTLGEKF